ncbi:hypothetical protein SAMN04487900_102129 [Prevotella communis]|uniref:Uncharacterized protein n=1 Tax=Prevotella communis TaxID=2913614 RepID=A0A1H0DR70_9BACT|nr:hypothetical protein SAMN04487900_102129 [Prevotella communis]
MTRKRVVDINLTIFQPYKEDKKVAISPLIAEIID